MYQYSYQHLTVYDLKEIALVLWHYIYLGKYMYLGNFFFFPQHRWLNL